MKFKLEYILIFIILIVNLSFRLFFVNSSEYLSSDFAYFHLRNLETIQSTGKLEFDELSYGGRALIYPTFYYYFLAFFTFFWKASIVLKIIPEVLISLLPIIIFLIVKLIVKNPYISLFCSILASFIPIIVEKTLNQGSIYSITLPLIFLMFYSFLYTLRNKEKVYWFVILSFILPFVHPSVFVFVVSMIFYSILLISESMPFKGLKREMILFSSFILILIQFIIYNKAFNEYGINFISGNLPTGLVINNIYTFSDVLTYIGVAPLIFGAIGIYLGMFRYRKNSVFLFTSVILSIISLLVLKLIDFYIAMMFIGLSLCIFSGVAFKQFFIYLDVTKLYRFRNLLIIFIISIAVLSIYPTFNVAYNLMDHTISNEEVDIIQKMGVRIDDNSPVLADEDEGHYITYFAVRKNIVDNYYLLAPNSKERLNDVASVYKSWSRALALNILKKYGVRYIYLSERTRLKYNIEDLKYVEDENCFTEIERLGGNKFYEIRC